MNRTFRAHVHLSTYCFLLLLGTGSAGALWFRFPLLALPLMVLLVVVIERILHTAYILTDTELVITHGRFSRTHAIPLGSLVRVEKCRVMRLGRHPLLSYLLVVYGKPEKYISLMPKDEDDFMQTLIKRRTKTNEKHTNPINKELDL